MGIGVRHKLQRRRARVGQVETLQDPGHQLCLGACIAFAHAPVSGRLAPTQQQGCVICRAGARCAGHPAVRPVTDQTQVRPALDSLLNYLQRAQTHLLHRCQDGRRQLSARGLAGQQDPSRAHQDCLAAALGPSVSARVGQGRAARAGRAGPSPAAAQQRTCPCRSG